MSSRKLPHEAAAPVRALVPNRRRRLIPAAEGEPGLAWSKRAVRAHPKNFRIVTSKTDFWVWQSRGRTRRIRCLDVSSCVVPSQAPD